MVSGADGGAEAGVDPALEATNRTGSDSSGSCVELVERVALTGPSPRVVARGVGQVATWWVNISTSALASGPPMAPAR